MSKKKYRYPYRAGESILVRCHRSELRYLQSLKHEIGVPWVELIYRGLGLKRPSRPGKNLEQVIDRYKDTPDFPNT